MQKKTNLILIAFAAACAGTAAAQTPAASPAPPLFATTKVEGTENVYIFRYQNHQSMFVVTPAGVIATDPISYGRPQAAEAYIAEIKRITSAPIRYLIYSHQHFDHAMGGRPFKEAGAVIVAHRRAKERLDTMKNPAVPSPDEVVDDKRVIELGGTVLELHHPGRNHSDSSLVMFLPKERIIFAVDWNQLGTVPSRLSVNDSYPNEWEESIKKTLALAWDRQIPGHPGPGGRQIGTRQDMEEQLAFTLELSAKVKEAAEAGKCFDPATKEVRFPGFAHLGNYEQNIEWNIHRWCGYWGRGH